MNTLMKTIFRGGLETCCRVPRQLKLMYEVPSYGRCLTSITSSPDFKSSSSNLTIEMMETYGVKNKQILEKMGSMPALTSINPAAWKTTLEVMIRHGFNATNVVDMAIRYPKFPNFSPKKIEAVWSTWVEIFGQRDIVRSLIMEHPTFLSLSSGDIISRCEQLKAVTGSYKFAANVLSSCPQIMFQNLSELENVTDYISTKMIVRNAAEYYKSTALGCTLDEVKTRHVFLVRCGKYKLPKLKQNEKVPTGNPSLSEIFDTSEEEFATKTAGVTLEEFVVFQTLYEEEMRQADEDLEDSETDDDSDEDSDVK